MFIIECNGVVMNKALPNAMAVDFQKKVQTTFIMNKSTSADKLLFPLSEPIGLYLEINTNKTLMLPFAIKNILDALTNTVYFDDVQVILLYSNAGHGIR